MYSLFQKIANPRKDPAVIHGVYTLQIKDGGKRVVLSRQDAT